MQVFFAEYQMVNEMIQTRLHKSLLALLQEPLDSVLYREMHTYDDLRHSAQAMVLFGAGRLGRKILGALRQVGVEPVAFADNNPSLWGEKIEGLEVLSLGEAVLKFSNNAAFVVSIWNGIESSYLKVKKELHQLGCLTIVPFMAIAWKWPDDLLPHYCFDLPHRIIQEKERILRGFNLFADETSQALYISLIRWRLWMDFDGLPDPIPSQYFPANLLTKCDHEVFVDCGAFDGDTIRAFLTFGQNSCQRIVALEPDADNFSRLEIYVKGLPQEVGRKISLMRVAAYSSKVKVPFNETGNHTSGIDALGAHEVPGGTLDEILENEEPTFIKMDIEGGELDALMGAQRAIKRCNPVLAVGVYHKPTHLWDIPLFIASLSCDYRFFLRAHAAEGTDVVCYAIPKHRGTHGS
jgi:FkbM family methyltransferase